VLGVQIALVGPWLTWRSDHILANPPRWNVIPRRLVGRHSDRPLTRKQRYETFGAQASTWAGVVGDLAAGGYQVIAYDRRGYGRSIHRPVRDYRVHVSDLATLVLHLGAPAHIVGWSSGAAWRWRWQRSTRSCVGV
jgi:Alpha/beta hydrolase family